MPRAPRKPRPKGTGPTVFIYGAGSWNSLEPDIAGWSASIKNTGTGKTEYISGVLIPPEDSAPEGGTINISNIRAEMVALVKALESLPDDSTVSVWIPSDFIPNAIHYKKSMTRKANLDVWEQLDKAMSRHVIKRVRHEPLFYHRPEMMEVNNRATRAKVGYQIKQEENSNA